MLSIHRQCSLISNGHWEHNYLAIADQSWACPKHDGSASSAKRFSEHPRWSWNEIRDVAGFKRPLAALIALLFDVGGHLWEQLARLRFILCQSRFHHPLGGLLLLRRILSYSRVSPLGIIETNRWWTDHSKQIAWRIELSYAGATPFPQT